MSCVYDNEYPINADGRFNRCNMNPKNIISKIQRNSEYYRYANECKWDKLQRQMKLTDWEIKEVEKLWR